MYLPVYFVRTGKEACIPIAENLLDTLLTLISTNIKQVINYFFSSTNKKSYNAIFLVFLYNSEPCQPIDFFYYFA